MFSRKRPRSLGPEESAFLFRGDVFRATVERERMRSDRTGQPLSMITIDIGDAESARGDHLVMGRLLGERIRSTDVIGLVDRNQIGVLLPDTAVFGAQKLVYDIRRRFADRGLTPDYCLYAYPVVPSERTDKRDGLAAAPVQDLKSWFAEPLPTWKRSIDIIGAGLLLIGLSPLLLGVAMAVKTSSPGPIIFAQERSGLGGSVFRMYKFRSMNRDAELEKRTLIHRNEQDGPAFKIEMDPRVTPLGRILRKTSIDELPQLWNVLKGDMSLVGPRPLPCGETERCKGWQRRRVDVTPGITCVWQVNGRPRESFDEWARMDISYASERTLSHDVTLLVKTIPAVFSMRGAG